LTKSTSQREYSSKYLRAIIEPTRVGGARIEYGVSLNISFTKYTGR